MKIIHFSCNEKGGGGGGNEDLQLPWRGSAARYAEWAQAAWALECNVRDCLRVGMVGTPGRAWATHRRAVPVDWSWDSN